MTIGVNVFDKAEIKEDQKTEFKTSIFVDPETQRPGFRQMMTIAETLAAPSAKTPAHSVSHARSSRKVFA